MPSEVEEEEDSGFEARVSNLFLSNKFSGAETIQLLRSASQAGANLASPRGWLPVTRAKTLKMPTVMS